MTGDMIQEGMKGSGYDTSLPVHPTFLYESLWCLLGFLLLHILSKKAYRFRGEIFCGYLVWYGVGRFFIESLRTDSLMAGTMKTSQLVAVLAIIGGVVMFFILRRRAVSLPKSLATDAPTEAQPTEEEPTATEADETAATAEAGEPEEPAPAATETDTPTPEEDEAHGDDH